MGKRPISNQRRWVSIIYKIAICDDEKEFVAALGDQVAEILKNKGIAFEIAAFPSGEALLNHLQAESALFDLIFLDIFMNEINGIDAAKAIRITNDSTAIIFTTASTQYVFSGYEVQALQYLLKPINSQALTAALMVDLKRRFENRYFVFKAGGMTQKIAYDDIEYFESALKSVKLFAKQKVYEMHAKISEIEASLPGFCFCRCHRGFIVNLKQVAKMNVQSLTTTFGTEIPIGKTYAKAISRAFLNYIGGDRL